MPEEPTEHHDSPYLKYGKTPWEKFTAYVRRHKLLLVLILIFGVFLPILIFQVMKGVPTLDQLENPHPELATRIISADGEPLDQFYIKNRTTVKLREVPKSLTDALIATEDRDFYKHWGMNVWRTFKSLWTDVVTLSPKQGASTITQQLARNLYLSQEKSVLRKLREAVSAIQIERTHTKNEILEMYLNVCYMGRGAYGIAVASQVYFGKDVSKLTPAQCAFLIGILKGPENYDPEDNYDRAIARRNTVLDNMVDAGLLDAKKAEKYKQEPIKTVPSKVYQGVAPHFVEMIRQQLQKMPELAGKYDFYRDGLVVYTTLNAQMQRAANRAVDEHIAEYQKNVVDKRWNWKNHKELQDSLVASAARNATEVKNIEDAKERIAHEKKLRGDTKFIDSVKQAALRLQASFVCLDQKTGQILAMVGSSNYREHRYGLNHVTQIIRQPGSSFKPIVYASAFEKGATPESVVSNEPIEMPDGDKVWRPSNFAGEAVGGQMSVRSALQWSSNLCAVHAITELTTIADVVKMAKRLGIKSNIPAVPSIALGAAEVMPLELASAYSTFANDGVRATPYAILRIEDRNGKVIYRSKPEFDFVFEPKIAQMMTVCLKSVVDGGTANSGVRRFFGYPAAGKTGTTQNYADAWFCGYTPLYTACAWVGFDDKRVTFTGADGQGGRAAAPIWGRFMKYSYEALKPKMLYFNTNWNGAVPISDSTKHDSTATPTIPSATPILPGANDNNNQPPGPPQPQPKQPIITPQQEQKKQ